MTSFVRLYSTKLTSSTRALAFHERNALRLRDALEQDGHGAIDVVPHPTRPGCYILGVGRHYVGDVEVLAPF